MCTNPAAPWAAWDGSYKYDFDSLVERIEKSKEEIKTHDSIYLTGGEPTLHPRFLDFVRYLSENFPNQRIKLLTNGRMFSYRNLAKRLLSITDNFDVNLSLYGPNKKTHNAVTRARGSFGQTVLGLENLLYFRNENQSIDVRFVLTKITYKKVDLLLKLVKRRFPSLDRLIIIFPEIEHYAEKNLDIIGITYKEVEPYLKKAFDLFDSIKELRLYHFPLCSLSEELWPYAWRTLDKKDVIYFPFCKKCAYKKYCLGAQKNYVENVGEKEFHPLPKKVEIIESGDKYRPVAAIKRNEK